MRLPDDLSLAARRLLDTVEDRIHDARIVDQSHPSEVVRGIFAEFTLAASHESALVPDHLSRQTSTLPPTGYSLYVLTHDTVCVALLLGILDRDYDETNRHWIWRRWPAAAPDGRTERLEYALDDTLIAAPDLRTLVDRVLAVTRSDGGWQADYWRGRVPTLLDALRAASTPAQRREIDTLAALGGYDDHPAA